MNFSIRHAMPGRLRLHVPELCRKRPLAETVLRYRASLEALQESHALTDGDAARIQALSRQGPEELAREALRLAGHKLPVKTKFVMREGAGE